MNDEIRTEDGVIVHEGDRVYDYYNMKPGVIVPGSLTHAPDVWFDVKHDDGTRSLLNGSRICSITFAQRRGFKGGRS
jgi:hypothetical protein